MGAVWDGVEAVLEARRPLALVATGGGSQLVAWMLNHPGASRAVVEAQVPYHERALAEYLGFPGPHRCEAGTAREMAAVARARAGRFGGGERALGLGLTAALATTRQRRGADRAWIGVWDGRECRLLHLRFRREAAGRLEQEEALCGCALQALVGSCGAAAGVWERPEWVELEQRVLDLGDPLGLLLAGELEVVEVDGEGRIGAAVERRERLLFPGSFNPLHEGHAQLAAAAAGLSGRQVALEISVENVDKPPLTRAQVERRLAQFGGRFRALVTRAPTFQEKARLFAGAHFAIGYDTAVRLFDPRYYEGGEEGMWAALEEMRGNGCRFWVAGRLHAGTYRTLEQVEVPGRFAAMFAAIPEGAFRMDISSTQLRARRSGAAEG